MKNQKAYDYVVSPSPFAGAVLFVSYELPELREPINDELSGEATQARRASEHRKWLQPLQHLLVVWQRLARPSGWRKSDPTRAAV